MKRTQLHLTRVPPAVHDTSDHECRVTEGDSTVSPTQEMQRTKSSEEQLPSSNSDSQTDRSMIGKTERSITHCEEELQKRLSGGDGSQQTAGEITIPTVTITVMRNVDNNKPVMANQRKITGEWSSYL